MHRNIGSSIKLREKLTMRPTHSIIPLSNLTSEPVRYETSFSPVSSKEKDLPETDTDCRMFNLILYVVIFGLICVFGIIGNILSFVVLRWERHSHVATFLLQVMACADNLFLLTTGFSQMSTALTLYFNSHSEYDHPIMAYVTVFVWPLVHITQMWTIWITVVIAFNRYVAICLPFQAPLVCTMKQARIQVSVIAFVIVLYNVPRFLEHRIEYVLDSVQNVSVPVANSTELKQNNYYNYIYENGLYCLFVYFGPLFILVVMNSCLIRELIRARRRLMTRQLHATLAAKDHEQNLTLVMVVIIIIFLVCQTPAFINQLLYYAINDESYVCGMAYFYYFHISNIVVSANSAVNFVVYCVFRRQFREKLHAFCRRDLSSYNRYSDGYPLKFTGNSSNPSVYSRSTSIQLGGNLTTLGYN